MDEEEKKINQSLFKESPESFLKLHKHETESSIPSLGQRMIKTLNSSANAWRVYDVLSLFFILAVIAISIYLGIHQEEKENQKHLFSICVSGCILGKDIDAVIDNCLKYCDKQYPYPYK